MQPLKSLKRQQSNGMETFVRRLSGINIHGKNSAHTATTDIAMFFCYRMSPVDSLKNDKHMDHAAWSSEFMNRVPVMPVFF
jgi:hypothetical protein